MDKARLYKKLLLLIFIPFIFISIFNIGSGYFTALQSSRDITLEKLEAVSRHVSSLIDGDVHNRISRNYQLKDDLTTVDQDADYAAIHKILANAHQIYKLNSPIYTFIKSKEHAGSLEFIATSSKTPYYRHLYSTFPEKHFKQLDQGGRVDIYNDEFGDWLSAFFPIRNASGEVVGYVQADERYDILQAGATKYIMQVVVLNHLVLGIIILFILPLLKKIVRYENYQKKKLQGSLDAITKMSNQLVENEQKLKEYAIKLETSNKNLQDFAHVASHDLKAPLTNILSFSKLLKTKEDQLDKHGKEFLHFIMDNSGRAQKMVDGLLNYSTISKNIEQVTSFDLSHALKEAILNLQLSIQQREVQIITHGLPVVKGNQLLMIQVLQNLISNGIKYNQSQPPIIEIGSGNDDDKGAFVYVKDNGIGIPKAYQKDVFKMFRRLHSNEYEGTGIGLAFCANIIAKYGGEIWLDSQPDIGTTFYFTLAGMEINNENLEDTATSSLSSNPTNEYILSN